MIVSGQHEESARTLSRGTCFLYVAPCAYEDIAKVGFARDPLVRLHALHGRFYEFFDLDAGYLIETDSVREARTLETRLHRAIALHNAPAPLVIREQAGGFSEWFRGAGDPLAEQARLLAEEGFVHHASLRPWLRRRLLTQSAALYAWTDKVIADLYQEAENQGVPATSPTLRRVLLDALDAYVALDVDLAPLLPPEVLRWHQAGGRF
ncbi:hypothetical protein IP90_00616 [Luteimonas cucumeris]|uniref:Uncharacterized protein n=1 Tax=Luteimonas cucumeris TaxID=985012 RepID=A0A562LA97_9GAMM|nr:GIY-YIG nuclease family protein [Luteimonas cucumeris]TWI04486.1 hypothetical protein IP90_00616 [Luteimonas cucumeris]